MSGAGGVAQRQAGVIGVHGHLIDQRGVLVEQFADAVEIADPGGGAEIVVGAAGQQIPDQGFVPLQRRRRQVAPAAVMIVSVGEMKRPDAVGSRGVDVGAAFQKIVDHLDLPRHHRPVDRLAATLVRRVDQLGALVEQGTHVSRVAGLDRGGDGCAFGDNTVAFLEPRFKKGDQLLVPAFAGDCHQRIACLVSRDGSLFEHKVHHGPLILPHGEAQGGEVLTLARDKVRISRHQVADRFQIAADRGADHRPHIHAASARPGLKFLAPERRRLDHPCELGRMTIARQGIGR